MDSLSLLHGRAEGPQVLAAAPRAEERPWFLSLAQIPNYLAWPLGTEASCEERPKVGIGGEEQVLLAQGIALTQALACVPLCLCEARTGGLKEWKLLPGKLDCQWGPLCLTLQGQRFPSLLLAAMAAIKPVSEPAPVPRQAWSRRTLRSPTECGVNKPPGPWELSILPDFSFIHSFIYHPSIHPSIKE